MKGEMKLCGWIKRESNCIDEIRSGVSFSNNRNDAKWEWQFKMKNDAKWEGQSEYALFLIFFFFASEHCISPQWDSNILFCLSPLCTMHAFSEMCGIVLKCVSPM